jgi:hypothetical protein
MPLPELGHFKRVRVCFACARRQRQRRHNDSGDAAKAPSAAAVQSDNSVEALFAGCGYEEGIDVWCIRAADAADDVSATDYSHGGDDGRRCYRVHLSRLCLLFFVLLLCSAIECTCHVYVCYFLFCSFVVL